MSKEKIRLIVEAVANEKDISREVIFEALEAAMVTATKKRGYEHVFCSYSCKGKLHGPIFGFQKGGNPTKPRKHGGSDG